VTPRVEVVPYDPSWPERFEEVRRRILAVLPQARVEHAGSTSVTGLAAKPVVDVVVLFERFPDELVDAMESAGFPYVPEYEDALPFRRYFRTDDVHVHAYEEHAQTDRVLAFRDWLRAHPDDAAAYGVLKRELAELHADDVHAYTAAKDPFIRSILERVDGR
jgi:GrpB-like predicted nucleotidyltransferase (UPF0157 family)